MVVDMYSSQVDLCFRPCASGDNDNDEDPEDSHRAKKNSQIPNASVGSLWRILKQLSVNKSFYREWMWLPKALRKKRGAKWGSSPKDKGYGKLVSDEEKRSLAHFRTLFQIFTDSGPRAGTGTMEAGVIQLLKCDLSHCITSCGNWQIHAMHLFTRNLPGLLGLR